MFKTIADNSIDIVVYMDFDVTTPYTPYHKGLFNWYRKAMYRMVWIVNLK